MAPSPSEQAAKLKEQGTEAFKNKEFDKAAKLYGEAIALSNSDHILYSNRSAAYAGAKKYKEALADGQKCVELKPDFSKGYGRVASAQYHLGKLIEAKKIYKEGLKYDSESQFLKTGLKDTERSLKPWFVSVLKEAADAQSVTQLQICEATHKLVADGCTSLSFLEAHRKMLLLDLPSDALDKYGISDEDFQQTVEDFQRRYDYEVITAVQQIGMPSGKGDADKAGKIDRSLIVDAHKFMEAQMKGLVEEFSKLPDLTKHSIPKKEREYAAELLVSVAVESHFKISSEDLELAVAMHEEQLQVDQVFAACQEQIAALMQQLMEPPFVKQESEQTSKSETCTEETSRSSAGSLACSAGVVSVLGLALVLGLIRWRTNRQL